MLGTKDTAHYIETIVNTFNDIVIEGCHFKIYELPELIRKCSLMISVDTGTSHIAVQMNKKSLIFGTHQFTPITQNPNIKYLLTYEGHIQCISLNEIEKNLTEILDHL